MTISGPGSAAVRILLAAQGHASLAPDLASAVSPSPSVILAQDGRMAARHLRAQAFDVILADLSTIADLSAEPEDAVGRLARLARGALLIVLSDGASVSASLAAMRAGAHEHIAHPVGGTALASRIAELAERHGKQLALAPATIGPGIAGLVGSSSQMRVVFEQIARIARLADPAFLTGEAGSGKSSAARAIHALSARAESPLVSVACSGAGRERLEAELFGLSHGAVAGVEGDRRGAIERADGGTLVLEEIAALDLGLQGKLLRLLQTGMVSRIGETGTRRVDIRLVCTTSHNPVELIGARRLREELFYRLHVLPLHLPPLRQRGAGDIAELATHFLLAAARDGHRRFAGFAPEAMVLLTGADWPGNASQLQAQMQRLVPLLDGSPVSTAQLAATRAPALPELRIMPAPQPARQAILPLWQQEQRIIEDAIASLGGNVTLAAAALELSPSTIYRKRQAWAEMAETRGAA